MHSFQFMLGWVPLTLELEVNKNNIIICNQKRWNPETTKVEAFYHLTGTRNTVQNSEKNQWQGQPRWSPTSYRAQKIPRGMYSNALLYRLEFSWSPHELWRSVATVSSRSNDPIVWFYMVYHIVSSFHFQLFLLCFDTINSDKMSRLDLLHILSRYYAGIQLPRATHSFTNVSRSSLHA